MLYAIFTNDQPHSLNSRRKARPAHLAYLKALRDAGHLVLAGPHPAIDSPDPGEAGFSGSLIVADFPDRVSAEAWAAADPYQEAGVYQQIKIKPFMQVFP